MTHTTQTQQVHPAAKLYAKEFKEGHMDRREFLARTTMLGVSATAAYALGGAWQPGQGRSPRPEGRNIADADGSPAAQGSADI